MYSDNGGCYGGIRLLVLLIFFAMFANNGGDGGIFGNGGNRSASTAAATDALIQQSNMRSEVAGIASRQDWHGQLLGGAVQGIERTRDAVAALDTKLCQEANNRAQQINALSNQLQSCCCDFQHQLDLTNRGIIDAKNDVLNVIQQNKYEALQNENKSLKAALALKDANCARDAQTDRIIDAVQGRSCCNTYQQESIHVLHRIAEGISGLQASQTAQSATLAQILAKVNEPATTTTPAA